jgi:hypothetical protein
MILCTFCYDESDYEYFIGIYPQSTCARCGRLCLGYCVVEEALPAPATGDPTP